MSDSTDVYQYFMERPNVMQRLNHHITAADCLQVDFSGSLPSPMPAELIELNSLSSLSMSALIAHGMVYYTSTGGKGGTVLLWMWLFSGVCVCVCVCVRVCVRACVRVCVQMSLLCALSLCG